MSEMIEDLKAVLDAMRSPLKKESLQKSDLLFLLPYIGRHWGKFFVASLLMLLVSLLALPGPYLAKYIVDDVLIAKNLRILNLIILGLFLLLLFRLLFSLLTNYSFTILNQEILVSLKRSLFAHLLKLPLSFFDKARSGYLVSRIQEIDSLGVFFSSSLVSLLIGMFEFVFCLLIMLYLNWKLTVLSFFVLPVLYMIIKYYSRGFRVTSLDFFEKSATLSSQFQETLSGLGLVKSFATEERETQKIEKSLKKYLRSGVIQGILSVFSAELITWIVGIGGLFVLWFSGRQIIHDQFTIGGYVAFAGYLAKLYGPIQLFASSGLILQPALAGLHRASELLQLATEEENPKRVVKLEKMRGEIEFQNVFFSYDGTKKVLHNINFRIEPGEKIAFLGPNGSGKTTLIRLLLGLYPAKEGRIIVDGKEIDTLVFSCLREKIGIVSQNIFLFDDTIRNNILYSRPESTEEQLIRAARLADAHDFITQLPNGYETIVGERGTKLSGGEMQKISIARTLLKDPDIIIFDEATSQIDCEAEKKIYRIFEESFKKKTCIIIAHRIFNKDIFDRVYFLENGRMLNFDSQKISSL